MSEGINRDRRTLLANGVVTVASKLSAVPPIKPGTSNSFTSLKQIDAGLLNVGYAEAGPADGTTVVVEVDGY